MDTIQWRGETVPIRSEKVRLSLLRSRELTREIDDKKDDEKQLDMFIELFSAYDDAFVVVRADLQNEVCCSSVVFFLQQNKLPMRTKCV